MKKIMFSMMAVGMVLFASNAFAQKEMRGMKDMSMSKKVMMAMHSPMMMQPMAMGKHPEISFLENMIPHHQGAVDSSKILLETSDNAEVKAIAMKIIEAQEKEIAEFKALIQEFNGELKNISAPKSTQKFDATAKKIMSSMMTAMSNVAETDDVSRDFLACMIPHHQGAIDASKQIAKASKNARIQEIAQRIIADQEKEIAEFKAILAK
ncbi:MAG: DUF305 domain-containing protein [Treponemataceae bacterium]